VRAEYPEANLDHGVHIVSLHDELVSGIDSLLFLLMGAVGIVVLIATVNLANLLVARASSREEEIAVRRAIGATPARLARQMLTESVVLAMLGGAAGLGSSDGELWYPPATVVGVVGDVRNAGIAADTLPAIYFPIEMASGWTNLTFALRTVGEPSEVLAAARDRLRRLDPAAPMFGEMTAEEMLARQRAPTR
jgi:cell division protein FtsX